MTAFYIYRALTHSVQSITWTAEQAARVFATYKHDPVFDMICELPLSMGIDIYTCKQVPAVIFIEGNKRWSERQAL